MKQQLSAEELATKIGELNQQDDVQDARIVTFANEPHIHIDYQNGNIGVVSPDGKSVSVIPCSW